MASETMSMNMRIKLSAMMFFQFMLFAVFWVPFAGYLSNTLGFTVAQVGWIMGTMAWGCLLSPIIGMIADRHFASQKVLAVLNLLGGALLVVAAFQTTVTGMFIALLFQQLCYMPTWGLTSSIAMTHSPSEQFPQVRAFGSFGWVAAAIFSIAAGFLFKYQGFDSSNLPLLCGAGVSLASSALALTLPNTPPPAKGEPASVVDALGLKAASLMKQTDFAAFILISTLVMIPFMIYFNLNSMFLQDMGFKYITFTMNLGQFGEIFFMLLITLALARMGVKWAMTVGLVTMAVRYAAFWLGSVADITAMYYIGIIIHGVIFGFFFVGGQIFVDKKAPPKIRAQAQGFLFLITFGIGTLLSMEINSRLIGAYTTDGLEAKALSAGTPMTSDMSGIPGAKLTNRKLFPRALNDFELASIGVDEKKAKNILADAEAAGKTVDLTTGVQTLADLPNPTLPKEFTFDATLVLPKLDEKAAKLNGTVFAAGDMKIGIKDGVLFFKSGDKEFSALRVGLPTSKEEEADRSIRLSGVFDGKKFKLYTGGSVFEMRDWEPIWMITTIISVVLLGVFVVGFNPTRLEGDEAEEAPTEEEKPAVEEADEPAEEDKAPAADEAGDDEAAAADEAKGDDGE